MSTALPPAEELALVDRELAQLDARRSQLLARRAWLLHVLHPPVPAAPRAWGPRAEASPPSVQNVLLTLGGVLLTVAAVAFTLVSWGHLGIGGRAAVLAVVTVAALGAPVPLLRRGLVSTAESVAALGLVLTVLDAYALYRVALPGSGAVGYTAAASAVLCGVWAAYGLVLGRLRIPLPASVAVAGLPLPLWALAADAGGLVLGWAALVTAAGTAVVAERATARIAVRVVALTVGGGMGGWALLAGVWFSVSAGSVAAAFAPGALLLAAGAVAVYATWRTPAASTAGAVVAGLAAVAAVGGVLRAAVPSDWAVLAYLLCGVALLAAPQRVRQGFTIASGTVAAVSVAWALPAVALVLAVPLTTLNGVWAGAPAFPHTEPTAPLVLLTAATALVWFPYVWSRCVALALACATVLLVAGPSLASFLVTTAAALAVASRPGLLTWGVGRGPAAARESTSEDASDGVSAETEPATVSGRPSPEGALAVTALVCALVTAVGGAVLALGTRSATFVALGVLCALFAGVAVAAAEAVRTVAACSAVVAATGLVAAGAAAAGLPAHQAALALLAVPAATAALGARLRRHPVALPVEVTGAAAGLLAVGLAVPRPAYLALVLALGGLVAAATAVREERRPVAGWVAGGLFLLATWVRLGAWEVSAPEAYTLPVTVPALAVGVLRRRRDAQVSSWTAYGPGLAATLLPSLAAAWGDDHWPRPLLLGAGALLVTLAGARLRLQAPLVLGGIVLGLDALHELAPYVVQAVGALPRWLPPLLAGLLLLAVGATYEQRLRDARRLRERLGRLH
ncbi:SCO7613 C-terminal domain-containing membrane protein [Streptomyces purpureus]|uniref:SCO7613 C-terminal domain-containing membrane protein n=1 Tax=Streptomyces purpureus TaxID=1951 RepID=UPI0037B78141